MQMKKTNVTIVPAQPGYSVWQTMKDADAQECLLHYCGEVVAWQIAPDEIRPGTFKVDPLVPCGGAASNAWFTAVVHDGRMWEDGALCGLPFADWLREPFEGFSVRVAAHWADLARKLYGIPDDLIEQTVKGATP